jgi:hypothetical protein
MDCFFIIKRRGREDVLIERIEGWLSLGRGSCRTCAEILEVCEHSLGSAASPAD